MTLNEPLQTGDRIQAITNSIGMRFLFIKPGTYMMGSPEDEPGRTERETLHQVTLTEGFYMQTTPVTQAHWNACSDYNPSWFKDGGDDWPVENVSWFDAYEYIKRLNNMATIGGYRLPTEAEWEYACRAGTTTPFYTGACLNTDEANYEGTQPLKGCPMGIYREHPLPVGSFSPNPWGLYDMHGNVWEWCNDWYDDYPAGPLFDPRGPEVGDDRVSRGGAWGFDAAYCRSAFRSRFGNGSRSRNQGFRLVLIPR